MSLIVSRTAWSSDCAYGTFAPGRAGVAQRFRGLSLGKALMVFPALCSAKRNS